MGTSPHPYKHEWSPIVRRPDGNVDLPETHRTIQQMNANHELWGWKFPSDVFHIETVTALLRHPGFIVVTRDLTDIALSSVARQDVPFEISLYSAAMVFWHIADRIRFWPWPILVVPFAEALQQPNALRSESRPPILSSRSRKVIGHSTPNRISFMILVRRRIS
jgi:hypothetical protein